MGISKVKAIIRQVVELNFFVLVLIIMTVVLLIPGNNSIYSRISYDRQLKVLTRERDDLKADIEKKRKQLDHLRFRKDRLEKYAREQFLMKADDEDLYLVK